MTVSVDLWQWRLTDPDTRYLSPDEHARAARFVFARDRDRYVAGRARLRHILGGYLQTLPQDVRFDYGAHGRPAVRGIDFNLSHTDDLAMLAVARDLVLGVDIEAVRPITDLPTTQFSPAEQRALAALPTPLQREAFFRCWTRKEAWLKAKGTGLATDLASFEVTLAPGDPPRLLRCDGDDAAAWVLCDLSPAPGIAGALAVRACGQAVALCHRGQG